MRSMRPFIAAAIILIAGAGYLAWQLNGHADIPAGLARANGRTEAERTDIATKYAGRIKEITVDEGDKVKAGQVVARLDSAQLEAQLREAEATANEREHQLNQAEALLRQRHSELALAEKDLSRSKELVSKGFASVERVDQRQSALETARATVGSAKAQVEQAKAGIEAAKARVASLQTELKDYSLVAPIDGRIQYRLAEPGEVLAAGGKVLTMLDLTNVYMTIFLPTVDAGRLAIGSEARIIFDAAPKYVVPAKVTFVASEAQFTPKQVETQSEREKLMFRVKVRIPQELLEKYERLVKTGITGVAYVKVSRTAEWPPDLAVKLPE